MWGLPIEYEYTVHLLNYYHKHVNTVVVVVH